MGLEPVDRAEVTIVVDNFVDLLMAGTDGVRRYLVSDFGGRDQLIAEHGFSALITVESHGRRSSLLYDGGLTPAALARSAGSAVTRRRRGGPIWTTATQA